MNHVLHVAPIAESPTNVAPAPGIAVSRRGARETALDTLRSFATVRVMVWHAFGIAAITYLVAAMPAMFFVTGSLLAKSFERRPLRTVLHDRFIRLFVPLWTFGLVAWTAMIVAARRTGTTVPWHAVWAWTGGTGDRATRLRCGRTGR